VAATSRCAASMSRLRTVVIRSSSPRSSMAPGWSKTTMPARKAIKRGDAGEVQVGSEFALSVDVDLCEHDAWMPAADPPISRAERTTRAAPRRPELDQGDAVPANRAAKRPRREGDGGHGAPGLARQGLRPASARGCEHSSGALTHVPEGR
jgi:hypothetical protein